MTSFYALYGREASQFAEAQRGNPPNLATNKDLLKRKETIELVKTQLTKAQDRMKFQTDKHKSNVEFKINEWVFVEFKPKFVEFKYQWHIECTINYLPDTMDHSKYQQK